MNNFEPHVSFNSQILKCGHYLKQKKNKTKTDKTQVEVFGPKIY